VFSENISAALVSEDERYPVYLQYPWDSTNSHIANLEQITVDDTVNSLDWSNYKTYPKYNYYDVYTEPGGIQNNVDDAAATYCRNTTASCTILLRLQINSQSLISEVRHSDPGISKVDILLDEAAIVGGLSFLSSFLNMYMT
jgi:hypothetical protein